uniref:Protein kinase domain-containing protein n=2 Tax=Zea mays TaxID=4577 RepID=A0A804MDN4_MAIZE
MPPRGAALLLLLVVLCAVQLGTSSSTSLASYLFGFWSRTHQHRFPALAPGPAPSPQPEGAIIAHPVHRHHRRRHHASPPPSSFSPERQDCSRTTCSAPLTSTPIGSPCGCVYPMQIQLDLGVAPYQLFPRIDELEIEVAAGTFLKQSQVRIMGAGSSLQDPEKTTVTIDLVPLGQKFDRTSALLISNRFLQKKVPINSSTFGDYVATYVHYPGLASLVPIPGSLGPVSSNEDPFGANIHNRRHHKINSKTVAIIALSAVVFVLTCLAIGITWRFNGLKHSHAMGPISSSSITRKGAMRSSFSGTSSSAASFGSTIGTCPSTVKTFTITELEKATENFSFNKIIGEGGYGRVYRGVIEDGVEVAVKLLTRKHQNRDREFIAEVEMLSRLHHRNLVKLIGICIERSTRCLVFELVPNGSVESHLHGSDKIYGPTDFDTRMKIALGAARGLAYLHEDANPHVIHRDFKASNVLLENDFTPKVADFGLAKEASDGMDHISTQVMGTFGYVAPEYAMTGHLLVKSDVYSYGVVLLELLSGRKPVDMTQPPGSENLVTWARPLLTTREGLQRLVDPSLPAGYDFEKLAKAAAIASMCVHVEASHRPFMGEVVQALKLIHSGGGGDETCSGSFVGGATEESPWNDVSRSSWNDDPPATPGPALPLGYGSDPAGADERRPRSASSAVLDKIESLAMYDWSGPLRTKGRGSFYRLRGSMSEHGRPSDDGSVEGYLM